MFAMISRLSVRVPKKSPAIYPLEVFAAEQMTERDSRGARDASFSPLDFNSPHRSSNNSRAPTKICLTIFREVGRNGTLSFVAISSRRLLRQTGATFANWSIAVAISPSPLLRPCRRPAHNRAFSPFSLPHYR